MNEEDKEGKILITRKKYEELIKELEMLKGQKRAEVSEKIKQSISFGDLSENSEYDSAKQEQAFLESQILEIESTIARAQILDETTIETNKVNVGCKVELEDVDRKVKVKYILTGSSLEADPDKHKISWTSPVGQGLMGHKIGDVVEIVVPKGRVRYKILNIERSSNG